MPSRPTDPTPATPAPEPATQQPQRVRRQVYVLAVIGALTAFGPLAIDLYLPAIPDLARMLGTAPSLAQLTISACLVGLALGQLVVGPLSDRVGRLRPLVVAVSLFALTSLLCALATSIWVLLALRLVQGLSGAGGIVVARAMVRDMYDGADVARVFSRLMVVMGAAPIAAPVLGGAILRFTDWRGLFVALGLIAAVIALAVRLVLHETHPTQARHTGGVREQRRMLGSLVRDRTFGVYMLVGGLQGATLFTYISMSTFVLRAEHGVGPQGFSYAFAANAVGLIIASQVNGSLVTRYGPARMQQLQLRLGVLAGAALTVTAALQLGLVAFLVSLWVAVFSLGGVMANNTALALGPHARLAGSASALLGTSQYLLGAFVPPVVSALATAGWVMGLTMTMCSVLSLVLLHALARHHRASPPDLPA